MWPVSQPDANYVGADPELPYMDNFLLGAANVIREEEVQAFVRAGLFRSFTARKVTFHDSFQTVCIKWPCFRRHKSLPSLHVCAQYPLAASLYYGRSRETGHDRADDIAVVSGDRRTSAHKHRSASCSPARSMSPDCNHASMTLVHPPMATRAMYKDAFRVQQPAEYPTKKASEGVHVQSGAIYEDIIDPVEQASKAQHASQSRPILHNHVHTGNRTRARSVGVSFGSSTRTKTPSHADHTAMTGTYHHTRSPNASRAVQIEQTSLTTPSCLLSHICPRPQVMQGLRQ